jgi:hypothetical protein
MPRGYPEAAQVDRSDDSPTPATYDPVGAARSVPNDPRASRHVGRGGTVDLGVARRRAATAAIAASAFMLAGYGYATFVIPRAIGDPVPGTTVIPASGDLATWTQIPTALSLLVIAGVPLLGAALLLSGSERRRLVGLGIIGAFALLAAFSLPGHLGLLTLRAGWTTDVMQFFHVAFLAAGVAALVFVLVAISRDRSLGWTDPRRANRPGLLLVFLAAVVAVAVLHLAPPVMTGDGAGTWAGGLFSGGFLPSFFLQQFLTVVLPQIAVVAVGVAAAGVHPARVGAAAGAVVAAHGIVTIVGVPTSNAIGEQLWGHEYALTAWYWLHVAAVVVLVATVVLLWSRGDRVRGRTPSSGGSRPRVAA